MNLNRIATELEFFIKGITDKKWLQERNNHIWDEWAYPKKAPYGHSPEAKQQMLEERDLGAIYGFQWRHFGAEYVSYDTNYAGQGFDQLEALVKTLKSGQLNRRMLVSAWNPPALENMALPPCHYAFQVTVTNGKLNLLWNQRSVDVMLGLPFNIASYALLLHLLAKEANLEEGKLVGFLADVHIYVNHVEGAHEQLKRNPSEHVLPDIVTEPFSSIFNWKAEDTQIINYISFPAIKFEIAV
jgi:thymidylate synthase